MSPDEARLLGCVYVDQPRLRRRGVVAGAGQQLAAGLDDVLCATVRRWINKRWPFARVADPGRELRWDSVRRPGGPGTPRAG